MSGCPRNKFARREPRVRSFFSPSKRARFVHCHHVNSPELCVFADLGLGATSFSEPRRFSSARESTSQFFSPRVRLVHRHRVNLSELFVPCAFSPTLNSRSPSPIFLAIAARDSPDGVIEPAILFSAEFLKHAPCMQKVKPEYELCYKRYQKTTQEIERANHTAASHGSLKSLCW